MGRFLKHIGLSFAALLMLFASCRKEEAKVIPRDQLADIYTEMLMTDQWILHTPDIRKIADTSLVYEPILAKYGYTTDDYVRSVDFYMNDPERFARILRTSSEQLTARLERLREKKKKQEELQKIQKERERLRELYQTDFKPSEFFPYLGDEPYVHYYDSLSVEPDSVLRIYRLKPIERADTLFDRIRMVISGEVPESSDTSEVRPEIRPLIDPADSVMPPKRLLRRPEAMQGMKIEEKFRKL